MIDPTLAEAISMREALSRIKSMEMFSVIVESDSLTWLMPFRMVDVYHEMTQFLALLLRIVYFLLVIFLVVRSFSLKGQRIKWLIYLQKPLFLCLVWVRGFLSHQTLLMI